MCYCKFVFEFKRGIQKQNSQVKRNQPATGWFKLNSDGSSFRNPGRVGGGGIIRNADGEWVTRYARAIRNTAIVAAELWVLRDGINLCLSLNLTAAQIELNAKLVVDLLKKDGDNPNRNDEIVADCREGLKKFPLVKIQQCFREANKCTDALARREVLLSQDFTIFSHSLDDVALLISLDFARTLYNCSTSCMPAV